MVYSARRFVLRFAWCCFVLVFFGTLSIAIISLGEERDHLSAFRAFVQFTLVCFLSVSSSSWYLGRAAFVIEALPGLFVTLFFVNRG